MLKNENIICLSSIDWDFIWQGHQQIMANLAENGNRVLFIENTGVRPPNMKDFPRIKSRVKNWLKGIGGIRKEAHNLYIFSPLVIPFPYLRIARWLNYHLIFSAMKKWMKIMDFSDPIVWTFLPTPLSLSIIDNLIKKAVVYYFIDNLSVSSSPARKIKDSEIKLIEKADLVFVTSTGLYNYCSKYSNRVYKFPFAVNFQRFEKARLQGHSAQGQMNNIKRPIIGYVGGVHKWIDLKLVCQLARQLKDYSFVFLGPVQTDISLLSGLKNVHFLGKKGHERLPLFIKDFDICIIPYLITDYTKNVYPTKLNEYLAMGKPVFSTRLPEIVEFNEKFGNVVYIEENSAKFAEGIKKVLAQNNQELSARLVEIAKQNSWDYTIENMSVLIDQEIENKKVSIEAQWRDKLRIFYRQARKKVLYLAASCFLAYYMVFHTAFFWFLSEPLKIQQIPKKADVIVVFGGGVGETGSPGKSTLERAHYASWLYHQGFADKIIFSAGYLFVYNDAENMRLIALSEEVPSKDIILERESHSTYDNVKFTKAILDENNWRSILLVSSPYNMRRASLVFNKLAPGVEVTYAPVKKCQFFSREGGVNLEQVRAIIHEYLGIVYYWWKARI